MIIDSLTHITRNGSWFQTHHEAKLPRLLESMQSSGVDKSILVGVAGSRDDDFILTTKALHPEKFIPVAAIHDSHLGPEEIDKYLEKLKAQGFSGIKIHPRHLGISLDSKIVEQLLDAAVRYKLTTFICTIIKAPAPTLNRPLSDVIQDMCEHHPNAKIVLVHGGYHQLLSVSEVIRPFENVLLDLSHTLTRFYDASVGRDIQFLLRTFERRICLGSDFPETTFGDVLACAAHLGFSREKLESLGVLGDNLLKFLNS